MYVVVMKLVPLANAWAGVANEPTRTTLLPAFRSQVVVTLTGEAKLLVVLSVRLARVWVPPELIKRLSTELLVALMFTVASDEVRPTWATAGLTPTRMAATAPRSVPFVDSFIADSAAKGLASATCTEAVTLRRAGAQKQGACHLSHIL